MIRSTPSSEILDRTPPRNLDAEKGVLGSMLIKPDTCDDVALVLKPDDFADENNAIICKVLFEMRSAVKRIDITLVAEAMKKAGVFETIGAAYLAELYGSVPTAAHAVYYAEIVRDNATKRGLIHLQTEGIRKAYSDETTGEKLLEEAQAQLSAMAERRSSEGRVVGAQELMVQALDAIDQRESGKGATAIETGFVDLDTLTGGLRDGELSILAARPSMGKTALAINIAEHVGIKAKLSTLFVSLEMSAEQLAERMLSGRARINAYVLRGGQLSKEQRRRIVEASSEISTGLLEIDETPTRTVAEIVAIARRFKRKKKLRLVVIDYLQLISPENTRDPREVQVAKIARGLKALARELKIPVLCLAQLNRQTEAGENKRPRLSHLRESGAIEQDADVVMFVHREEYFRSDAPKGEAEIIVAKQRNGPTDTVKLTWLAEFTRFENAAHPDAWASSPGAFGKGQAKLFDQVSRSD